MKVVGVFAGFVVVVAASTAAAWMIFEMRSQPLPPPVTPPDPLPLASSPPLESSVSSTPSPDWEARFVALEERLASIESQIQDASFSGTATSETAVEQMKEVAEQIGGELEEKMQRLASRQRNRNMSGEWKASLDELQAELGWSDAEVERAHQIFDDARDDVFELLNTPRADGGTLLDDFVGDLQKGDPEAMQKFIGQIFTGQHPDGESTYLQHFEALNSDVRTELAVDWSDEQLAQFTALNVAVLEVETGYDPVRTYVEQRLDPENP